MRVAPLGPVAGAYYLDNSGIAVIEGPVGSGKTTASALRLQRHAYAQVPGTDGTGSTRFAIVRNTKKQLQDTTMKSWFQIFPPAEFGEYKITDATHQWRFQPKGHRWPIAADFIFRALDDEADVRDLLSLEVTGFWFNEVREIIEEIIGHARARCRYLGGDRPHTWSGWIGDTNPWDTEHWLQERLVTAPREGWKHFQQPGGMEPDAENLENLEQTAETLALSYEDPRRREQGRKYYARLRGDYSSADSLVYVDAQRGRTRSGKPIYSDYNDRVHCLEFQFDPRMPVDIGLDFGRTPAAAIAQELPGGRVQVGYELVTEDMGVEQFAEELSRFLSSELVAFKVGKVTGDPAGNARDARDETAFDLLKGAGIIARPAHTNEPSIRVSAVNKGFRTMSGGKASLLIHPRCKILRRACIDGYHYRKLQVMGDRYADEPNKNIYSHVAEALQYLMLGLGYGSALVRNTARGNVSRPRMTLT